MDTALVQSFENKPLPVHPGDLIMRRIRILGSQQNGREYLCEALQIAASGKVKVMTEIYSLDQITKAYERVAVKRTERFLVVRNRRKAS